MKSVLIKKAGKKGKGLFANRDFAKNELIMRVDLSKLKSIRFTDIAKHPQRDSEHWDYVGRGKYVLTFHPYSYINHSCEPNVRVKHLTVAKSEFYALRDIEKGEELTVEYGVNILDHMGNSRDFMDCKCSSRNCRKRINFNFFKQPIEIQRKYWKYLPSSIRRRYRDRKPQ